MNTSSRRNRARKIIEQAAAEKRPLSTAEETYTLADLRRVLACESESAVYRTLEKIRVRPYAAGKYRVKDVRDGMARAARREAQAAGYLDANGREEREFGCHSGVEPTQSTKTLVVCAPNLGCPGMPAAEFGPAAASDTRPTPAEVFHVLAQHASRCSSFHGLVLAPAHYDPIERQRAAVTAAHHFRCRADAVRAVEAITWVALPTSMCRDELARVIEQESTLLRQHAGNSSWVIAMWNPEAFGIESGAAAGFVSCAVFGEPLTL